MVNTIDNGSSVPPFLLKCYEMVEDESTDALICWSQSNDSFIIRDATKFSSQLLPKYFKHSNFSSFVRQLNIYGFRKTDTDRWEFANERFLKGQKHLLQNIVRRKQSHGQSEKKSSLEEEAIESSAKDDKWAALWKEVESLKKDKNALAQQLIKARQHQQTSQSKLLIVLEQLKGMEKNQQQMLSFIMMAMQNPGFFIQLLHPKENHRLMPEMGNSKLSEVSVDCGQLSSDAVIVKYKPPPSEDSERICASPSSNQERQMDLDISSDELKDFLMNMDFRSGSFDGNEFSVDSHGPLIIPDLPECYGMLEQFLLSISSSENDEPNESDNADVEMEMNSKIEPAESGKLDGSLDGFKKTKNQKMKSGHGSLIENSENLDFLTGQMTKLKS